MSKIDITKAIVAFIVGAGTTKIVRGIVVHNTDPENLYDIVTIVAGSVALGGIVSNASKKYTDRQIDLIVKLWDDVKTKLNESETA